MGNCSHTIFSTKFGNLAINGAGDQSENRNITCLSNQHGLSIFGLYREADPAAVTLRVPPAAFSQIHNWNSSKLINALQNIDDYEL